MEVLALQCIYYPYFDFRDKKGKIIIAAEYQNTVKSGEVARVEPNRKWFGTFFHDYNYSFLNCLKLVFS